MRKREWKRESESESERKKKESKNCTLHPVCCELVGGMCGEYEEDSISPIVNVLLKKKM